jgi:hypothetical protein
MNLVQQQLDSLAEQLEQSRSELLELTARVHRLIGERTQRQALLQRIHRGAPISALQLAAESHYLCSLCATGYATRAIQNVRSVTPGATCDHCHQPAIVWLELKPEQEHDDEEIAAH